MLAACTPAITWTDEEQHVVAEIRGSSAAGPADRRVKHLLRARRKVRVRISRRLLGLLNARADNGHGPPSVARVILCGATQRSSRGRSRWGARRRASRKRHRRSA